MSAADVPDMPQDRLKACMAEALACLKIIAEGGYESQEVPKLLAISCAENILSIAKTGQPLDLEETKRRLSRHS